MLGSWEMAIEVNKVVTVFRAGVNQWARRAIDGGGGEEVEGGAPRSRSAKTRLAGISAAVNSRAKAVGGPWVSS